MAPIIFFITICSFKNIILKITKNTVDNCFNILKLDGLRPYLASILSLSVNAYITVTIKSIIYVCISVGNLNEKKTDKIKAKQAVKNSSKTVKASL